MVQNALFDWLLTQMHFDLNPSNQAFLNTELYVPELLASKDRVIRNLLTLEMNML